MTDVDKLPRVMKPIEVAHLFGVEVATVKRWCQEGKLPFFWTPGGHRRFYAYEIAPMVVSQSTKESDHERP